MTGLQDAKSVVRMFYDSIDRVAPDDCVRVMKDHCARDLIWRGFHPFGEIRGPEPVAERFWVPLKVALTSMQRRLDLFFAGYNRIDDGRTVWVGTMGHLMGLLDSAWLGIRATEKIAMLRYAAFHRVDGDRIAETAMFFNIPHLMIQAGMDPFPPQTGAHLIQPGPMTHNGLLFDPQPLEEGEATQAAIDAMIHDIARWSGGQTEPLVEELRRSWNEDMIWWGPAGIGATYTIPRYARQHSGPFRKAFGTRRFNAHIASISEGHFGGFFGWPNLTLSHGGGFMGMPANSRESDMRVIDMYRREADRLPENWAGP